MTIMAQHIETEVASMKKDIEYIRKDFADFKADNKADLIEIKEAITNISKNVHNDYASKWVEKVVTAMLGVTLLGVLGALIKIVIKQ